MAKKAEAWKEYGNAAMVDMMLDTLPKVNLFVAQHNATYIITTDR